MLYTTDEASSNKCSGKIDNGKLHSNISNSLEGCAMVLVGARYSTKSLEIYGSSNDLGVTVFYCGS